MLKITRLSHRAGIRTIKLEGDLLAPWVGTVRDACAQRERWSEHLCLDLAAVTFVDATGIRLLRELVGEGVEIAACSSFIAQLLNPEG